MGQHFSPPYSAQMLQSLYQQIVVNYRKRLELTFVMRIGHPGIVFGVPVVSSFPTVAPKILSLDLGTLLFVAWQTAVPTRP